jgi:predicted GIY-YIG superfamily endonuclease
MSFYVYILKCNDDSYYTGHTDNLEQRVAAHQEGKNDGYTATRLPVILMFSEQFGTRLEALEMERRIKGWSRKKKEAMMRGDWDEVSRLARHGSECLVLPQCPSGSTSSPRTEEISSPQETSDVLPSHKMRKK